MPDLILVVDDDILTRIQLRELLQHAQYRVIEAKNGEEALNIYIQQQPDMVLLDAMMPKVDGFTCCERLRKLPNSASIPILIITALYEEESVERAFAVGATDYITKPIHWSVLSQKVKHFLEASQAIAQLREQTQQAQSQEAHLRMALEAANMGTWEWDICTNQVSWSENKEALFGMAKGSFDGKYETFIERVHPEDRSYISDVIKKALNQEAEYDIEFRVILPNGNIRWMSSKGDVFYDAAGLAVRMSGIDIDITKRKQSESVLEIYANRQAMLAELSHIALAGTDLTLLMEKACNLIVKCLGVEYAKVLEKLRDKQSSNLSECNDLLLRAGIGWQSGALGTIIDGKENSQAGYTLLTQEPVVVPNLVTETRFQGPALLTEHQVVSGISVVINGSQSPFGVLGAHTKKQRDFNREDIFLMQAVANTLATAIERKLSEEKLRQSEERLQIVARATNDAVWDWDLCQKQVWWNENVHTLFGYSTTQIKEDSDWWYKHIHPEDRGRIVRDIHQAIDSGRQFWSNEYRFRRLNKTYAYILDRGYVVHNHAGEPIRMIGAMMDISDRKRYQEELMRQNLRSQLFADVTVKIRESLQIDDILHTSVTEVQKLLYADRVLILRLRSDKSITVVKEAVVPGLTSVIGANINDPCFSNGYVEKYSQGRVSAIADIEKANIQPCHLQFLKSFAVRANLVVPILLHNQLWGLLIAHQCSRPREWTSWETQLLKQLADQIGIALAQGKLLEQETRQRQELAASNEELQQFAFVASHDLQEPLRKIKAFGDRLQSTCDEVLNEQGRDYLSRMQNASVRMQTLIEDLLTLSRVTTRAQPLRPLNLTQIVEEVLSDLEIRIQQTKGTIKLSELPTIKADPLQMRQLLQNLIGNALKFHRPNHPPVVEILSQIVEKDGDFYCQLTIKDNGIGFDEKYVERIFQVFQRLHGRSEYEGTGIGLAICRKIVERHCGEITATSKLGNGTTFIVTLPLSSPENMR